MPNIYQVREGFTRVLAGPSGGPDTQALFDSITAEYTTAYKAIQRRADALAKEIADKSASGEGFSLADAHRDERIQSILGTAGSELVKFASRASMSTRMAQRRALDDAYGDAKRYVRISEGTSAANAFTNINPDVATAFIGLAGDGSPLLQVFGEMVPDGVAAVRSSITQSLLLGENPLKLAARLRNELGAPLVRAQTVARTEVMRAYRESSLSIYQDNADLVKGWIWHANLSVNTCAYCIARHGSLHELSEHMASHPSCRCAMVPLTKSWEELGFDRNPALDARPNIDRFEGDRWLRNQPPDVQRSILGKSKYDAYTSGNLKLSQLIGTRDDARWGVVGFEKSLKDALGTEAPPLERTAQGGAKKAVDNVALQREAEEIRAEFAKLSETRLRREKELLDRINAEQAKLDSIYRGSNLEQYVYGGPEWRAAKERQQPAYDEQYTLVAKLKSQLRNKSFDADLKESARAMLTVAKPITMPEPDWYKAYRGDVKPSVQKGIDAFASLVGIPADPTKKLGVEIRGETFRAHFDNHGSIVLARGQGVGVIVHELGHWLEWSDPEVARKAQAFLERRTAGEPETTIYRGTQERGKKDAFIDHYMGKTYKNIRGDRYATEITSMGLQMFYEHPLDLATRDPDYFDFIYRLVRGGE